MVTSSLFLSEIERESFARIKREDCTLTGRVKKVLETLSKKFSIQNKKRKRNSIYRLGLKYTRYFRVLGYHHDIKMKKTKVFSPKDIILITLKIAIVSITISVNDTSWFAQSTFPLWAKSRRDRSVVPS